MSNSNFFIIKEANLSNNCPECYTKDGLKLTYKQKRLDNYLYEANGTDTHSEMYCSKCKTQIFPIDWTDDIERVVTYNNKALKLKPKALKLKPLAWVIIVINLALLAVIILIMTDIISFN